MAIRRLPTPLGVWLGALCALACGLDTGSDTPIPYASPTPGEGTPFSGALVSGRFATERVVALEVKNLDENHILTDPEDDYFIQQTTHTLLGTWTVDSEGGLRIDEAVCDVEISVIGGLDTVPGPGLLEALSPVALQGEILETGEVRTSPFADVWGARLPAPLSDPLPTEADAPTVWDQDRDGHPGATVLLIVAEKGSVFATTYVAQRVIFALEGQILSPDRVSGPVRVEGAGQSLLGAEEIYIRGSEPEVRPVADPTLSYFTAQRVGEGTTCADLRAPGARAAIFDQTSKF